MKNNFTYLIIIPILIIYGCSSDDSEVFPNIIVEFSSDSQNIFEDETINFTDLSTGAPTNWQWTFEGGIPSTSNEQNPSVLYEVEGVYRVTLVTSNGGNAESITKESYITVLDNLSNGLVGKFDLNGNGIDSSGFNNNGTIVGTVNPSTNREGIENSAMSFSEFDGYIDIGDATELKLTSSMSISVWVRANGNQNGWDTIVNKWQDNPAIGTGGVGYYLGLNPNGLALRWNVTNQVVEMDSPLPINQWVHIVVTFDGTQLNLYINGILENQVNASGEIMDNSAPFRIGQQSEILSGTNGFNGEIDDIYIYERPLNSSEILELFNN